MKNETIKEQIQSVVNKELINTIERTNIIEVLKKLREEKFVSKKEIENSMSQYLVLSDNLINNYLHAAMLTSVNYEATKKILASYEAGMKDLNKTMDDLNYPESDV